MFFDKEIKVAIMLLLSGMVPGDRKEVPTGDKENIVYCLVSKGDPHDPYDWEVGEAHNCPGSGYICAIGMFVSDIYTVVEAIAVGNLALKGCPKVDISDSQLFADIDEAKSSMVDKQIINDRTYYKRNIP